MIYVDFAQCPSFECVVGIMVIKLVDIAYVYVHTIVDFSLLHDYGDYGVIWHIWHTLHILWHSDSRHSAGQCGWTPTALTRTIDKSCFYFCFNYLALKFSLPLIADV